MTALKAAQTKKPSVVTLQNVIDNPIRRLPQVITVGLKKSGTRALPEILGLHPDLRPLVQSCISSINTVTLD